MIHSRLAIRPAAVARYVSNVPEGATIYGVFTQPFGAGVTEFQARDRLGDIIWRNGPVGAPCTDWPEELATELTKGIDWPNEGCEITFVLYSTED